MNKAKLPEYFKAYFWDIDFSTLDPIGDSRFIIKRALDRGNTSAIKWLFATYPLEIIKDTVLESRDLSPKTANFWADALDLDRIKVACLHKPYSPTQFGLSS